MAFVQKKSWLLTHHFFGRDFMAQSSQYAPSFFPSSALVRQLFILSHLF